MKCGVGIIYYNLRCKDYQNAEKEATRILAISDVKNDGYGKLSFWKACANGTKVESDDDSKLIFIKVDSRF